MNPSEFISLLTKEFLMKNVNLMKSRILEVGCGKGELLLMLQKIGVDILGIDPDDDAIRHAVQQGANIIKSEITDISEDYFDCVLFTRSLHHISTLNETISHAKTIMKKEGILLCEEFDYKNVSELGAHDVFHSKARVYSDRYCRHGLQVAGR